MDETYFEYRGWDVEILEGNDGMLAYEAVNDQFDAIFSSHYVFDNRDDVKQAARFHIDKYMAEAGV